MKLPHADRAVIDMAKLVEYCLNPHHPEGRHKARVFAAALGLRRADAPLLRDLILAALPAAEAHPTHTDSFGVRFTADLLLAHAGRRAAVRTAWIIRHGEDAPRLTTCYVNED